MVEGYGKAQSLQIAKRKEGEGSSKIWSVVPRLPEHLDKDVEAAEI